MPIKSVFGIEVVKGRTPHCLLTLWEDDIWMAQCYADFGVCLFSIFVSAGFKPVASKQYSS